MRKFRTTMSIVGVAVTGLGATMLTPVGPAAAAPATPAVVAVAANSPVPRSEWCSRPMSRLELYRSSSRFDAPSTLRLLDETQSIDLSTLDLRNPSPFADVSRVLWYRSLLWLAVAAVDAHENGRPAEAAPLAARMIEIAEAFPDPGSATPEITAISNAIGWDEGTTFRRAEALLCLSSYVDGNHPLWPRLRALLTMHAESLVDDNRYKGPPQRAVHNHGMLANLTLIDLGERLGEPNYRSRAIQRLANDSNQVFSPAGWSYEGSTMYQSVNIAGWRDARDVLRNRGFTAEADLIDARLRNATEVVAHLISPTGQLALIGNTRLGDSVLRPDPNPSRPLSLTDPDGGLAVGRWSWTDPNTTWWTALNQPRKGSHGHDDNTSITWQTLGVPVVMDIGQYDYDDANPLTQWMERGSAHNRAIPSQQSANEEQIRSLSVKRRGSLDRIVMDSTDKGPRHRREVLIDDARHSMQVTDTAASPITQFWHLAPGWTQSSATATSVSYTDAAGRLLEVNSSPGTTIRVVPPSLVDPFAGLVATGFKQVTGAPELRISGGNSMSTTFQLYPSAKAKRTLPPLTVTPTAGNARVKLEWAWAGSEAPEPKPNRTGKVAPPQKPTPAERALLRATKSVQGYRIQMRDPFFGWLAVNDDNGSAKRMSGLRKRLVNGTKYLFRVAPITKTGIGAWSEPVEAQPLASPAKPTLPVAAKGPGKSVQLSWTAPADTGGAKIRKYQVTVGSQVSTVNRTEAILRNLTPGKVTVLVQAENKVGLGTPLRVQLVVKRNGTAKVA